MRGLSNEIEAALKIIIRGLDYDFFEDVYDKGEYKYKPNNYYKKDGKVSQAGLKFNRLCREHDLDPKKTDYVFVPDTDGLNPDKMRKIIESKTSSFTSAIKMLERWCNSPNAPKEITTKHYIRELIRAGETSLRILRKALAEDIDFSSLEAHKHDSAIKAKPIILDAIFEISASIMELESKLERDDLTLIEQEFKLGYPERFAMGEFFPIEDYYKDWYNSDKDAVKICPLSSEGEIITIDDFNIQLPEVPKDKTKILFYDLPKEEQYWRRLKEPASITTENIPEWEEYIKEEFRRRREGIWFMNNGSPVYLTGNHYFALQWCKMLDTGGYMDFRYAQLNMFYHLEGCIIDQRCLGQLFVKSRRTGFTYIVLSIILNASTSTRNKNFGMTSKSDDDAKKAFLKYRYMLLNVPFYFRPVIKGKTDSPKEFEFSAPLSNTKEAKKRKEVSLDNYLNNLVDYQPTKDDSYDGQAMFMYLGDECFHPDTKIMMEDKSFKRVEDIKVGDFVMNGKGEPVEVMLKKVGSSELYQVNQKYGKPYVVSKNHRLLFEQGRSERNNIRDVIVTPTEYLNYSDTYKKYTKRKVFSGFEGDFVDIFIDPYVLGAWLGDGYKNSFRMVYNHKDKELIDYIDNYAKSNGFSRANNIEEGDNYIKVSYVDDNKLQPLNRSRFNEELKKLGIFKNKRIPEICYAMSRTQRLELIAGLIDTDGHKSNNNSYSIGMSNKELIEGIYHIVKGLGIDCSEIKVKKSNYNTKVYTISFTDNNLEIPCKLPRKKPSFSGILSRRNSISISRIGIGKYIGITTKAYNDEDRTLILEDYTLSLNSGKWKKPNDYVKHFGQISPTMNQTGDIVGKAFIGSTVGALNKGGSQFKEMHEASDINKRDSITNMTPSGLYRYFLPAQENMSLFTDKYGVCYQNKPEKPTYNVKGKIIKTGSLEYLIAQEEAKRAKSDKALNEQYRAFPRTIEHAFRDEASQSTFNITKLYEQIEYNDTLSEEDKYIVGNFEWLNGVVDSDVVFSPNKDGRFKVSWMPSKVDGTEHLQNNIRTVNGKHFPLNGNHVRFGCDPFSYKSTHGKGSKGGIHGKSVTLPEDGVPDNVFVVEYIARPPDETIFFEDVIKVIKFYGAPILIESNRMDLLRHMYNRGYRGFVMDRLDRPKNKLNPQELKYGGQMMSGADIIDSHMGAIGTWIQNYVGVYTDEEKLLRPIGEMGEMPFNETLKDWLAFNPDKRTEHDATISSGLAIMACQKDKYQGSFKKKNKVDVSKFLRKYNN